jgi:hypothetical protein
MRVTFAFLVLAGGCTALINGNDLRGTGFTADGGGDGPQDGGTTMNGDGGPTGGQDGGGGGNIPTTLSFSPSMQLFATTYDYANDLRLGDVNGDGYLDVGVVAGGNTLSLLINQKDGSFSPLPNGVPVCTEATHLVLEDLNGKLGAVVTCRSTSLSDSGVTVLNNTGNDTNQLPKFTSTTTMTGTLATNPFWAKRAFSADVDGDGQQDLIVADYEIGTSPTNPKAFFDVFYGGTTTPVTFTTAWDDNSIDDMIVTDLNNDQKPDVVLTSSGNGQALLFLNKGGTRAQRYANPTVLTVANIDGTVLAADIDHNGNQDLLFTSFDANAFFWVMGNGDGTFQLQKQKTTDAGPESIAVGDVNNDGKLDVAIGTLNPANTNYEAHVDVFLGDGAGGFADKADVTGALSYQADSIQIGDYNHDGLGDIVVGSSSHPNLYFLKNTSH